MPDEPIVIEGLTKSFDGFIAVDNLSLRVEKNTFLGFLGPNGAGKTTTIKMLTNLIRATSGKAYLNGVDIIADPKAALSDVGAVVETPEFYPYLTPVETFEYLGRIRGMGMDDIKRRTEEVLEIVKMDVERDKKIGEFSKGMKQRIAIGQAIFHEPSIIIFDEPTSGLDPRGRVEVRELLHELKRQNYTMFMSSHLLNDVQDICDNIAMMNNGRLINRMSVEELGTIQNVTRMLVRVLDPVSSETIGDIRSYEGVEMVDALAEKRFAIDFKGDDVKRHGLLEHIESLGLRVVVFKDSGNAVETYYLSQIKESR